VAVSSDEEGNSIQAWSGDITLAQHQPDPWGGEFSEWLPEDDNGNQEPVDVDTANSIIIWP
jgi:hypothetical protein